MRSASDMTTYGGQTTQSTAGTVALEALPGFDAQTMTVALAGIAGVLFVFAALNSLVRTATAKVRKR